jgi:hypothetical protein
MGIPVTHVEGERAPSRELVGGRAA